MLCIPCNSNKMADGTFIQMLLSAQIIFICFIVFNLHNTRSSHVLASDDQMLCADKMKKKRKKRNDGHMTSKQKKNRQPTLTTQNQNATKFSDVNSNGRLVVPVGVFSSDIIN